jgi:hypothetical protein
MQMQTQYERRLLVRTEIVSLLHLPDEDFQQLVDTRQILPIRIAGHELYDSKDLYQLLDSYRTTAARRIQ